jgi:hypothetical protein
VQHLNETIIVDISASSPADLLRSDKAKFVQPASLTSSKTQT